MAERAFLGWDRPCLEAAARFLEERYARGGVWDLDALVIAVPGARAGRRLRERLAERAAAGAPPLVPPRIVTPLNLPEELFVPARPVASELQELLAWVRALREADPDLLAPLLPAAARPEAGDLAGWASAADDFRRLHLEIAGERLAFADVAARCRELDGFSDDARWEALAGLHAAYRAALAAAGLDDRVQARHRALAEECQWQEREVVLLSVLELNRLTRDLLEASGRPVTALVFAPESEAAAYDELGALRPEAWEQRPLLVPEAALRVVDRPTDQARAALEALAELEGSRAADEITLGVGDETLTPLLERSLQLAGLPARAAVGQPGDRSRPALLLAAVADALADPRRAAFAALVRHPDLETWLAERAAERHPELAERAGEWLADLDRFLREQLPVKLGVRSWELGAGGPEDESRQRLRALHAAVEALLEPLRQDRTRADDRPPSTPNSSLLTPNFPLPRWSEPLAALLRAVYGGRTLRRDRPADLQLIEALEAVAGLLREQEELPPESPLTPAVRAPEALRFLLRRLGGVTLPEPSGPPAVELLGWLELALDDAPALVIAGVNEGAIPQGARADAFLPDRLRRALDLPDSRRRYARDAALLTAILHSRPHVTLISGRRAAAGDPLVPSRLLFAADEETAIRRARTFYGREEAAAAPAPPLLEPGPESRFAVPRPEPRRPVQAGLPVTAFRAYLACPYRFYLRFARGLEELDDSLLEMDGALFGSLAHDVLAAFGRSEARDSTLSGEIEARLMRDLERQAVRRFGEERSPAVEIQLHHLRRRLRAFARLQANHAREWRIEPELTEVQIETTLIPEGEPGGPFAVRGKIDRVDRHLASGRRLILDYKTSDSASTPEQAHRAGPRDAKQWRDLQLPLYLLLAEALGFPRAEVATGYLNLPKELAEVAVVEAEWNPEEVEEALALAREVARRVRAGVFWPPAPPDPRGYAPFEGVCLARCVGWPRLVEGGDR